MLKWNTWSHKSHHHSPRFDRDKVSDAGLTAVFYFQFFSDVEFVLGSHQEISDTEI